MNPRTCPTDSIHYMHLADPSEEGDAIGEEPKIKTRSNVENLLVTKLTLLASRGMITNEECAQLTVAITERG